MSVEYTASFVLVTDARASYKNPHEWSLCQKIKATCSQSSACSRPSACCHICAWGTHSWTRDGTEPKFYIWTSPNLVWMLAAQSSVGVLRHPTACALNPCQAQRPAPQDSSEILSPWKKSLLIHNRHFLCPKSPYISTFSVPQLAVQEKGAGEPNYRGLAWQAALAEAVTATWFAH